MAGRGKKAAAPKKKTNGYKMPAPIPVGEVIEDTLAKKKWRIGSSIGVGGFGEIYSACEHENSPKKGSNYPFVVKIEPHENGPLFVETHFYIRNIKKDDISQFTKNKKLSSLGLPQYFGNGSHMYNDEKYRYLVLERYGKDVWTLFKDAGRSFSTATVFQLGLQMLDILEYIHSRSYVHADIKGANILMGLKKGTENQAFLVDYGLATRVNDRDFKPDPKCAHNGTIEYTSRDAHLGESTKRGDLEILAYNMLQWIVGELPWEKSIKQPKTVQTMKEEFMKNVRSRIKKDYPSVPEALIKFFEYVNTMEPKASPDYAKCNALFLNFLKSQGKTRLSKIEFTPSKKDKTKPAGEDGSDNVDVPKVSKARGRKPKGKAPEIEDDDELSYNDADTNGKDKSDAPKLALRRGRKPRTIVPDSADEGEHSDDEKPLQNKRKSSEPAAVTKVKKTKLSPKATPPAKKNHANIATQTSIEKRRSLRSQDKRQVSFDSPISELIDDKKTSRNNSGLDSSGDISEKRNLRNQEKRQVSFDSPICELIDGKKNSRNNCDSSGDIFDDSFVIEEKKVKPKRKLLSDEEYTVKRVVRKKTTVVKPQKGQTWKNCPTIVNGRSPPE